MPNLVFVNGDMIPGGSVAIQASDRGFTLGDGAFETVAVVDGTARRLDRHLVRLGSALQVLHFDTRPTTDRIGADKITTAVDKVLIANSIEAGAVRITVSRGVAARGLAIPETATPTLVISASEGLVSQAPVSARICRSTRRNEHSPLSRIKSLGYLDNILALQDAKAQGADDAIMLNTNIALGGALVCASAANLFLVKDGKLFTPPVEDGAMPGLVREDIIGQMDVAVATLDEATLRNADEAFLTNSLSIRPLIRVDGAIVGHGAIGPVTTNIQQRFSPTRR